MQNIVEIPAFTLKQGVSEQEFLLAHKKFNQGFMSQQKGYVSHQLLKKANQWFDLVIWESMVEKEQAFKDIYNSQVAMDFSALIDEDGTDDDIPIFSIVKNYSGN